MYDSSKSIFDQAIFDVRYHRNESLINILSCSESNPHESINQEHEDLDNDGDSAESVNTNNNEDHDQKNTPMECNLGAFGLFPPPVRILKKKIC